MLQNNKTFNLLGCLGSILFVLGALFLAVYLFNKFYKSEQMEIQKKEAANGQPIVTPSPVKMEAPYSGAPVKGEPKQIVVPEVWDGTAMGYRNTANYTLANKMVVRWDLLPPSAKTITFGFVLTNPPIPGKDTHNQRIIPLIQSLPSNNGISVSYLNRGKYKLNAGTTFGQMDFIRESSDFVMPEERVEIRFTQMAPMKTRIEAIYNGEDIIISEDKVGNINDIRMWPQQLEVIENDKIQNIWLYYS